MVLADAFKPGAFIELLAVPDSLTFLHSRELVLQQSLSHFKLGLLVLDFFVLCEMMLHSSSMTIDATMCAGMTPCKVCLRHHL